MRLLTPVVLTLALSACGGGGGGGTAAPQSDGVLVPDVRSLSLSTEYSTDTSYKELVDGFLQFMDDTIVENKNVVKWESDIPVIFSGCGAINAFFGAGVDIHAQLQSLQPDPVSTFGPNATGNVIVMCHELTEAVLKYYFRNPAGRQSIVNIFGPSTEEEILQAALVTALIFEFQVLFHEIGHGLDALLIKDTLNNDTKRQNFVIPIPDACGKQGCDTVKEDFADWIGSQRLIEALKMDFADDPTLVSYFSKAWVSSLIAWDILGPGGNDLIHGTTLARQVNMLCYTYGALPEFRAADTANGSPLANLVASQGLDPAGCEATYQANTTATTTLLGSFLKPLI